MKSMVMVALLAALAGCSGSKDVVARAALSMPDPDGGTTLQPGCAPGSDRITIVDMNEAELFRMQPDTGAIEDLGHAPCLEGGSAVSVDRSGSIWVNGIGRTWVLDPASMKCKEVEPHIDHNISYEMAFVYDPKTDSELLYAVEIDTLTVIDPSSLERKVIGKLETPQDLALHGALMRGIVGTGGGHLFALFEIYDVKLREFGVAIGRIDLHTAEITTVWPLIALRGNPEFAFPFVASGGDFIIAVGGNGASDGPVGATRFNTSTGQSSLFTLATRPFGKFSMGASSCASRL
jgi:hypothetical protein